MPDACEVDCSIKENNSSKTIAAGILDSDHDDDRSVSDRSERRRRGSWRSKVGFIGLTVTCDVTDLRVPFVESIQKTVRSHFFGFYCAALNE